MDPSIRKARLLSTSLFDAWDDAVLSRSAVNFATYRPRLCHPASSASDSCPTTTRPSRPLCFPWEPSNKSISGGISRQRFQALRAGSYIGSVQVLMSFIPRESCSWSDELRVRRNSGANRFLIEDTLARLV
jgi:hypothetical protein